jgi:hormone-sensitive lipase
MTDIIDEAKYILKASVLLSRLHTLKQKFSIEIQEILDKFEQFTESQIFQSRINIISQQFLEYFLKYLKSAEKALHPQKSFTKYEEVKLKNRLFKLKVILDHLPAAFSLDQDDFRCLTEDHPRKKAIRSITKTRIHDKKLVKSQEIRFFKLYKSALASFISFLKYKTSNFSFMMTGFNVIYYLLHPRELKQAFREFEMTKELESLILVWNANETSLNKKIFSLSFPSITENIFIFIPRIFPSILEEDQLNHLKTFKTFRLFSGSIEVEVPIRVLSPWNLVLKEIKTEVKEIEAIIIEFHGGSMMAQSTFSHQSYSIKWANQLELPVFSVEYRLAPTYKFPSGLEDAWQAYRWLISHSESCLQIKPRKVILTGDSAGGNIIIAICLKAIQSGIRVPDGILASYPCVNWDMSRVSLGLLRSLQDDLLPYKLFKEFPRYYVNDLKEMRNFLVSPLEYAHDQLLKKFPRTRILLTLDDPLAYDTLEFVDRLLGNGVDVEIFEYPGFIHGTLCFGNHLEIPAHLVCVDDSVFILRQLIFE